jgi:two-component system cell cycle response regulator CpdR
VVILARLRPEIGVNTVDKVPDADRGSRQTERDQAGTQYTAGKKMILVVDDESTVREFVGTALRRAGYEVKEAASAEEALQIIQNQRPALLLTDIVMPGENGLVLAAKAHHFHHGLRAIFMTGFAAKFQEELSGSVCLAKPFSITELLSTVENAIGLPHRSTAG